MWSNYRDRRSKNPKKLLLTHKGHQMAEQQSTDPTKLLRAWERLNTIKLAMVKAGLLNGDATPAQVMAKLREVVPTELTHK